MTEGKSSRIPTHCPHVLICVLYLFVRTEASFYAPNFVIYMCHWQLRPVAKSFITTQNLVYDLITVYQTSVSS